MWLNLSTAPKKPQKNISLELIAQVKDACRHAMEIFYRNFLL